MARLQFEQILADIHSALTSYNTIAGLQKDALDLIAITLSEDATGEISSFKQLKRILRLGLILKVLSVGDQIVVSKETGMSVTVSGNISSATVNEDTFLAAVGTSENTAYEFTYDGAAWHFDGNAVELAHYGIVATGTPANGDAIVIHEATSEIVFDVTAINRATPLNTDFVYSVSLLTHNLLHYGAFAFSAPQALVAIRAEEFPSGLQAGTTYYVHGDHCCYNGGTTQDGDYAFTPSQPVPVGGKVRHSELGKYYSTAASYTVGTVVSGTWTTYDANNNVIESGLTTSQDSSGVLLGTVTAVDPQYRVSANCNFTTRNIYGSNRWLHSATRKWLNSDAAGAASGQPASWWYPSDIFDMPVKTTMPGFLHGLDPSFRSLIGKVKVRTALGIYEGGGYDDSEELVYIPSMYDMGFGKNNNVVETELDTDGDPVETILTLFDGASNADRIKTYSGTARHWWLRSPCPSNANERYVYASGALYYYGDPGSSYGVAACLNLI